MSSLRNSYRNIANPNMFNIPSGENETATATNEVEVPVPADKVSWTVAVTGPDSDYQVSVKGVNQPDYRNLENGLIDGTSNGKVAYFRGNIDFVKITQVSQSGSEFQYSIVGSNNL